MKGPNVSSNRLMSLDTLRGFDMWFISGGASLVVALCAALGAKDGALATQMTHVAWEGLRHHDTIFPLFMFLAGVSWPYSLASQEAKGVSSLQIHLKILKRAALLFAFGFFFQNGVVFKSDLRLMGVLNFIGPCWGIAALMYFHLRSTWKRIAIVGALLIGYWALLRFAIAPDAPVGADSYSKEWNIVSYLDRTLWPTHLYRKGVYEPESAFSITNGVVLASLGVFAGELLRSEHWAPARKALLLIGASLVSVALYFVFTRLMGDVVVKALWTSSFVLAATAYAFAMLALFYWIIDVRGWKGWTLYFRVIGMNSITIYLAQRVIGFGVAQKFFFGGLAALLPPAWGSVVLAFGYLAVVWAFLYFLYRRNIFLKV